MENNRSPLLDVQQACEYLRVGIDKLREEMRSGRLGFIQSKPGARIYFRQQDLDAWILRSVHPARPPEALRATYRKRRAPRTGNKKSPASIAARSGKGSS